MSKKILVTKDWHEKAMKALVIAEHVGILPNHEIETLVCRAAMKFMEDEMPEEVQNQFMDYVEKYVETITGEK